MRLKPFFGYYGSKWRIINRYPEPQHDLIVEPFAGSANYALRYPSKTVVLYELDEHVYDVWKYLIHADEDEIIRLPDLEVGQTTDDLVGMIPSGAIKLIGFWLGCGLSSPNKRVTARMKNPQYQSKCQWWGQGVRERIASQLRYIRHWQVYLESYEQAPDWLHATWFVDPPYMAMGKYYRKNKLDYAHLADWCRSRIGQVIVCENEGASWLPFESLTTTKGTVRNSKEVVYVK
mgnify:CR=1 FL=1